MIQMKQKEWLPNCPFCGKMIGGFVWKCEGCQILRNVWTGEFFFSFFNLLYENFSDSYSIDETRRILKIKSFQ